MAKPPPSQEAWIVARRASLPDEEVWEPLHRAPTQLCPNGQGNHSSLSPSEAETSPRITTTFGGKGE